MSDLLRTHDEAAAVLRYAATGARVEITRPRLRHWLQHRSERTRCYAVYLERVGREPLSFADSYSLPCPAESLRKRVRELVEST